jgi:hypothetical protein
VFIALVAFGVVIAGVVDLVRSMSRELVLLTRKLTDAAKGTASGACEIARTNSPSPPQDSCERRYRGRGAFERLIKLAN